MIWATAFSVMSLTAFLSWAAGKAALPILVRRNVLDHPNERSSHTLPTPTGGGIAVIAIVLLVCLGMAVWQGALMELALPLGAALVLALLSFFDDLVKLGQAIRLVSHLAASAAVVFTLPLEVFPFPQWLTAGFLILLLAWFINLYNFMDGIDGITGMETISIGLGLCLAALLLTERDLDAMTAAVMVGAAAGFLIHNWHKAKVFLGDVGSVPLGLLLGWLLLRLAVEGFWVAALILPLYYLADATVTLVKRAARFEKIWQAHKEHFYQKAVQLGWSHDRVVLRIAFCNLLLLILALVSPGREALCLGLSLMLVVVLLRSLGSLKP